MRANLLREFLEEALKKGFSLVELLIALVVISCITAAFTPLITKKFSSGVFGSGGNDLTEDCVDKFGENCTFCTSTYCIECSLSCPSGEYLDTEKCKCLPCSDKYGEDCEKCTEKKCLTCPSGQYLDSDDNCQSCSDKFNHCATCTESECTSCADGYVLTNPTSSNPCSPFSCSGDDFIQIGNLCITKKNMGDGDSLTIPSGVNVVNTGATCSSSTSNLCCWKGATSRTDCDNNGGGAYSGCNRTVCDWWAADYICKNFTAGGRTWRLATSSEMSNWSTNSKGLGVNGLQLCDLWSGNSSAYCYNSSSCPGSSNGWCHPYNVWSGTVNGSSRAYGYGLSSGSWTQGNNYSRTNALSVRCVAQMPESCEDKAGANCEMCDGNTCLQCASGYKLKNGKCEIDCASKFGSSCTECTTSACTACKSGYKVSGGKCVVNCSKFGANCTACTTSACTACSSGYKVSGGTCVVDCSRFGSTCASCTTSACTGCSSGYGMINGSCQNCSSYYAHCISCSSYGCTGCQSGYVLSGVACIQDYNSGSSNCSRMYGQYCTSCDSNRCYACAPGHYMLIPESAQACSN